MEGISLFEWLQLGISLIGPFFVVWYTIRLERKKSDEEERRKQAIEEAAKRENALNQTLADLRNELEEVRDEVANLRLTVGDMQTYDRQVRHDLMVLTKHHERNWDYMVALGELVSELASGMRDKHLDGNITAALAHFHSFEKKLLSDLASEHELVMLTEAAEK